MTLVKLASIQKWHLNSTVCPHGPPLFAPIHVPSIASSLTVMDFRQRLARELRKSHASTDDQTQISREFHKYFLLHMYHFDHSRYASHLNIVRKLCGTTTDVGRVILPRYYLNYACNFSPTDRRGIR
jgi:hypothetical protein